MKNFFKSSILAIAMLLLGNGVVSAEAIKREFRSVWMATVWSLDWPLNGNTGTSSSMAITQKNLMITYLDKLQEQNYTTVCFQVRGLMDALYNSSYEPWSSAVSGARGTAPSYDPLAFVVEECHKRGLECYAWVNPYRWSTGTMYSTPQDMQLRNNNELLTNGSYYAQNPGLASTQTRIINVCREIISNYAVDGILFDDYFYPNGLPETSSAPDYNLWRNSGTSLSFGDWRRDNINRMVAAVYNMIQSTRPDVRFGIGPAGVACSTTANANKWGVTPCPAPAGDWQYSDIYSEPMAWVASRTIDFISPQIYWPRNHSTAPYDKITKWWADVAAQFGIHHYASIEITKNYGNAEYEADIRLERQNSQTNSPGFNLYSTKYLNGPQASSIGPHLYSTVLTNRVLQPEITWKADKMHTYAAPANARKSGSTLSWTAQADGNRIIKYSVYAVPTNKLIADVTDSRDGGIQSDYLLGVTYTNSYTIPSSKQSGFWYAICVYDGFGHEHAPAFVNYPTNENAPKTTLLAPANGSTVENVVEFQWRAVTCDSYQIDFAQDPSFATIKLSRTISTNHCALNVVDLGRGKFYWRIVTKKAGANSTLSDVWSFTVSNLPTGSSEPGYVIATDGAYYPSLTQPGKVQVNMTCLWFRSNGIGNFTQNGNGGFNRSFVVRQDGVYVVGRTENSSAASTQTYVRHYDRKTGEHLDDIIISGVNHGYMPCNDIMKDSEENLIVANMVLNVSTTPIVLDLVDPETGNVTELCRLTATNVGLPAGSNQRIDHVAVYGDVTSSTYHVFAGVASSNKVLRWTVTNGSAGNPAVTTLGTFYPTSSTHLGIAPIIVPVSSTEFYVNGYSTALTRYKFVSGGTATVAGTFASAPSAVRPTNTLNGGSFFDFADQHFIVAPMSLNDAPAIKYNVFVTNPSYDYSAMNTAWTLPDTDAGIANVNSGSYQARTDYVKAADGSSVDLYTYVPGGGIAAYSLTKPTTLTNAFISPCDACEISISGRDICLSAKAKTIDVYTPAGTIVASAKNVARLHTSLAPGFYIVRVNVGSSTIVRSVVMR